MISTGRRRHEHVRVIRAALTPAELSTEAWFDRLEPMKRRFLAEIAADLAGAFQLAPRQALWDLVELVRAYEPEGS